MTDILDESDRDVPMLRALLAFVLLATIVGGGIDLALDAPKSWSVHVIFELALIIAALASSVFLWHGWWRSTQSLVETRQVLAEHAAERDAWRASAEAALAGLGRAIDERFTVWGLTGAEREIAMLLLKGQSHKQIAFATGRSERTVRQHAAAAYAKAGLDGRATLAAYFLEGVRIPGDGREG